MKIFANNRIVTFKHLRESGNYDYKLLKDIYNGNFDSLANLPLDYRADRNFMEPLLFAVKNEPTLDTYIVYKYYAENLQDNQKLASEIIVKEPELIKKTPISKNPKFIIDYCEVNPEIIKYMAPELKTDIDLIQDLKSMNNQKITNELIENCETTLEILENPELKNNKDYMADKIIKDASILELASDELKNDKNFLKEVATKNEQVIDYVIKNKEKFGTEGIKGVREGSRELTIDDCMIIIDELAQNSEDKRYEKVKAKIQERGLEDPFTVKWITAMVAQNENVNPETVKKVLDYSILTMEKTKRDLLENGKNAVNLNNMSELITPQILNKLKEKLELQGINIDENFQQKLDEYQAFYDNYHKQFSEQKKQKNAIGDSTGEIGSIQGEVDETKLAENYETSKRMIPAALSNIKTFIEPSHNKTQENENIK